MGCLLEFRCRIWVRIDKTQSEHNESGYAPISDMRVDIADGPFRANTEPRDDWASANRNPCPARIYSEKGMPPMFVTRALALGNAMNAKKTLAGSVMVASL